MGESILTVVIGGSFLRVGMSRLQEAKRPLFYSKIALERSAGGLDSAWDVVRKLIASKKPTCVVVAVPGKVNYSEGAVRLPPAFGIHEPVDMKSALGYPTIPIIVENDAKLLALGEYHQSASAPCSLVTIVLGTGIGSGIVLNGKILRGKAGCAGEIGYLDIGLASNGRSSSLRELYQCYIRLLINQPRKKRELADAITEFLHALDATIHALLTCIDCEALIFTGGRARSLFPRMKERLDVQRSRWTGTLLEESYRKLTFELTDLGHSAALLGAERLAMETIYGF